MCETVFHELVSLADPGSIGAPSLPFLSTFSPAASREGPAPAAGEPDLDVAPPGEAKEDTAPAEPLGAEHRGALRGVQLAEDRIGSLERRAGVGEATQVLDDLRGKLAEKGQHLAADPNAQKAGISVGGVLGEGHVVPREVGEHVGARGADQGPGAVGVTRGEHAEPVGPGASQQPQEDGLRPVVGGVGGGDEPGADPVSFLAQRVVSSLPRARLEVRPLRHDDARGVERDLELPGEAPGELELGGCLGAEAMVDPVGHQPEAELGGEPPQPVEQRHRVRSP